MATNAGGVCCVKYGVTREYVLELELVTGSAEVVRIGHRTAKGVAGYDLVSLLVGSEGTLGIVTEITVRLRSLPSAPITVAGFFPSLVTAGTAVRAVGAAGITPSALELMDRFCLEPSTMETDGADARATYFCSRGSMMPSPPGPRSPTPSSLLPRQWRVLGRRSTDPTKPTPCSRPAVWPTRRSSGWDR